MRTDKITLSHSFRKAALTTERVSADLPECEVSATMPEKRATKIRNVQVYIMFVSHKMHAARVQIQELAPAEIQNLDSVRFSVLTVFRAKMRLLDELSRYTSVHLPSLEVYCGVLHESILVEASCATATCWKMIFKHTRLQSISLLLPSVFEGISIHLTQYNVVTLVAHQVKEKANNS